MFYGISNLGAAWQRRDKERRGERAAIRQEFEQWKQANPYATAADFHSKVKQLGSQTPGGRSTLPDGMAIQRMALEAERRKQQDEADRERRIRLDELNARTTEINFLSQTLRLDPSQKPKDLLAKAGMEFNPANVELVESMAAQIAEEKAKADAASAMAINSAIAQLAQQIQARNPEMMFSDAFAEAEKRLGRSALTSTTPPASPPASPPAQPPSTPGLRLEGGVPAPSAPAAPASPIVPQASANPDVVNFISGRLTAALKDNTPQSLEDLDTFIGLFTEVQETKGGRSESEIEAALQANPQLELLRKSLLDIEYKGRLENAMDVNELTVAVDGVEMPLEEWNTTAFDNDGFISNAYIPPGMGPIVADQIATMFEAGGAGGVRLKDKYANMNSAQRVEAIREMLRPLGVVDKAALVGQREQMLADPTALNMSTTEDYLTHLDVIANYEATVADLDAHTSQADLAEKKAMAVRAVEMLKATFNSGNTAAMYGAQLYDPRDVFSRGEDFDPAKVNAWFDETIAKVMAYQPAEAVQTPQETSANNYQAEKSAIEVNAAMVANTMPVTSEQAEAATTALQSTGMYGSTVTNVNIGQMEEGEFSFVSPLQSTELKELLDGPDASTAMQALKFGMHFYLNFDMPDISAGNIFSAGAKALGSRFAMPYIRRDEATAATTRYLISTGVDKNRAQKISEILRNAGVYDRGATSPNTKKLLEALGIDGQMPMAGLSAVAQDGAVTDF